MTKIPQDVGSLLEGFSKEFNATVWERFRGLLIAAILVSGRRTVWRLIQFLGDRSDGHFSSYHRVFSYRRWSSWALARKLAVSTVEKFIPEGAVQLVGDDTVSQHRGEKVFGKGCHRDAVRSSHGHLVHRWGHKWVVLAVRIKLPAAHRTWALPLLVALYRTPEESQREGIRHKTPPELMQGLLVTLLRWFPERKFVFAGDGGFATHRLSRFASRHSKQLSFVSKLVPDAVLHEPPPARRSNQKGRPRVVGPRLATPREAAATCQKFRRLKVNWYGGGQRQVEVATGVGHWYRQGHGLVKIRWVFVRDLTGHHRAEYFYSTTPNMSVSRIIEAFVGRWDIEVTFEEMREHLGLETTRGRCRNTVLRVEPSLFLLYTLIVYWYACLRSRSNPLIHRSWIGKTGITFSDAIATVRRAAWEDHLFQHPALRPHVEKLPRKARDAMIHAFALAV